MSKAALDQFTRTTALELASHKVRVNCVNPGCIKTKIFKTAGLSEEKTEKVTFKIKKLFLKLIKKK